MEFILKSVDEQAVDDDEQNKQEDIYALKLYVEDPCAETITVDASKRDSNYLRAENYCLQASQGSVCPHLEFLVGLLELLSNLIGIFMLVENKSGVDEPKRYEEYERVLKCEYLNKLGNLSHCVMKRVVL